jgi:hypothetical protein
MACGRKNSPVSLGRSPKKEGSDLEVRQIRPEAPSGVAAKALGDPDASNKPSFQRDRSYCSFHLFLIFFLSCCFLSREDRWSIWLAIVNASYSLSFISLLISTKLTYINWRDNLKQTEVGLIKTTFVRTDTELAHKRSFVAHHATYEGP